LPVRRDESPAVPDIRLAGEIWLESLRHSPH